MQIRHAAPIRTLAALAVPTLILFAGLFAGPAGASYITMETAATATLTEDGIAILVSATNRGDEEAHHVQAEVRLLGRALSGPRSPVVRPGKNYRWETTEAAGAESLEPGRYGVFIILNYTDRNLYPFSAVSATYLDVGQSRPAQIFGRLEPVEIAHKGKVKVHLSNPEDRAREVTVEMVGPHELSLEGAAKTFAVSSGSEKTVTVRVKNVSALAGSSYRVYASVVYEEDGLHHAAAVPGMVTIGASMSPIRRYRWVFVGAGGLLVLGLVAAQFLRRKGSR